MRKGISNTHVIVMALLPRGTNSGTFLPVRYNDHRWPSTYTAALRGVNARLRDASRRDPKLHYLDCGSRFLKGKTIDASLMPDALHPNAAGHRVLAACMRPLIAKLMHQQSRT
jgi:lysophospholipase L1-like esterase